jgi:hypothetical protein
MRAGIEDVLIRPGLALDNALNGTAVGGFLQRHNILATPEQDEATYARDTSNLGTTLPDQAARFAGEAATAAPVLAAGGEALGAAAGAAGAGLDAAGAGTAANVTRGAGQLVTGNAGQWGAGVGQGAVRLASMSANGAAQGAGFNALTGRSPVAGAEIGAAANPLLDGALHAVAAGGEAALDSARPATQAAAAKISRALGRDGMTPTQLISNMEAMGPEATAADAGGQNVLRTADAVAVKPGASTAIAQQTLSQRAAERVDRLVSTAQTATGQTGTVHGTIDQLIAQRSADAAPLFQSTFQRMQPTADEIGKLQPLISSPEGQTALKTGLTIMRRSALGAGQPFDASEIGVTQLPNGQLGVAPDAQTMPLLHAIKEGFDDNVESLRDPVTGKLPNTKEVNALASMRDFYRSTLTNMYPRYASALQAWAGPSAAIDAVRMGRQAMNNDPEVTGKVVSAMPDSLKEFYLQGVTRQLTDKMQANPAATVNQVLKNRVLQNKIAAAFPTPEAYQDFITTLQNEARMMKTENLVNQGSQTAARGHAIEDLSSPLAHTAFALRDALAGSPGGAAYNAGRVIGHLAKGASPADDEMGLLLFTPGNTDELENLLMPKTGAAQKALATGVKGAGKLIGTAATGARLYGAPSQVQFNALTGNPQ